MLCEHNMTQREMCKLSRNKLLVLGTKHSGPTVKSPSNKMKWIINSVMCSLFALLIHGAAKLDPGFRVVEVPPNFRVETPTPG